MAKQIVNSAHYTFNAAAKTITFNAIYTGIELSHIKLITNVTTNTVIYQFNKTSFGGSLSGLVLTLAFNTATMSSTDKLQIFVEANFLIEPVKIYDSSGNAIGSELAADGNYHMLSSFMQNIIPHTGSSSVVNLAGGATFTGTSLSNIGVDAVQVNFKADQNCTIQLQQSPDNTNWDYINSYIVLANTSDVRTIPAKGSFCRVLVTNNGGSTTNAFRLQTVIVPHMNPLTNRDAMPVEVVGTGRNRLGQYAAMTFRTAGLASSAHNLMTIENPTGSGKQIAIKSCGYTMDSTAALLTASSVVRIARTTAIPSGGTVLTASKWRTADATTVGIVRGATASDGGIATAITATISSFIRGIFQTRLATAVGYVFQSRQELIDNFDDPFILAPGEAIVVQVVASSVTTMNYLVDVIWEDYIL